MVRIKKAKTVDSLIPKWFKISITIIMFGYWFLLGRALTMPPRSFYGFSFSIVLAIIIILVIILTLYSSIVWGYSKSKLVIISYSIFRYFRNVIAFLIILGLIRFLMLGITPWSFRGAPLYLSLAFIAAMVILVKPFDVKKESYPFTVIERISKYIEKILSRIYSIPIWIFNVFAAIFPILLTCAIIYFVFGAKLSDFRPYVWNDQTGYWLWVRSFSAYGFNVGYNVGNELIPQASFNHYGEGSPLYVYIYGSIAKLVGWTPQLPILLNFFLLAVAIYWFVKSLKLNSIQILLTSLVTIFFWPILFFLPTSSQETINQVIGFFFAGIFYKLFTRGSSIKPYQKVLFIIFIFVASLIRLSWALLIIPLIFLCLDGKPVRRIILSFILGSVLIFCSALITKYLIPPWGNSIFSIIELSLNNGPQILMNYFGDQYRSLLTSRNNYPNLIISSELLLILIWSLFRILKNIREKLKSANKLFVPSTFNLINVALIIIGGMFFYLVPGFFRIFIPPLLVTVLLNIAYKDYKPVVFLLGINIVFAAQLLVFYRGWDINFQKGVDRIMQSREIIDQYEENISQHVVYDHSTSNPWCNTLLIPLDFYDYRVTVIPVGIGVSHISFSTPIDYPLKSKYLLLDQKTYQSIKDFINVESLTSLPEGDLYYNIDSGCLLK